MRSRGAAALLVCLPMLGACSLFPLGEGEQAPQRVAVANGYGKAVAAITTEAWSERPDLAANVILVEPDGSWTTTATAGVRMPTASMSGSRLVVPDAEGQVVIGPNSSRRLDRDGDSDLGEWSGQAGSWHFSVLNDGTRGQDDGRYFFNIAAWDGGEELVEGEIDQDALGFAACGDDLYAVTRPWRLGDDELTLTEVAVEEDEIVTRSVPVAALAGSKPRLAGAACLGAKNDRAMQKGPGGELALLAEKRGVPELMLVDIATATARTIKLPELTDAYLLRIVGAVGDDVLVDTHDEIVRVTRTGRVTSVVERSEQSFTWSVGVSGEELLVWEVEDADHVVRWVSADGDETSAIRVSGVQEHLGHVEENVFGAPVSLR
ncbi:hypothetical protein [Nocardioides sp. SYSU D00065]|uniref:hypothetical protein n=1 Tax=Nocardioides sp. SYSU D00065 TaxID=2817378 RepID=UPI001B3398A8|nr:hypothetical protein [Nocardioides sp. SYSU D00065]